MTRASKPAVRYVTRAIKWPPDLWSQLAECVPQRERSEFIRKAVKDALYERGAERLKHYYETDPDVQAWTNCVGTDVDE